MPEDNATGSWASSPAIRSSMRSNRGRDTAPELAIRRALHKSGLRYRVDYSPLGNRRRADIVFTRRRVAIFVDGCFWHGCPQHATLPATNASYWVPKLQRNKDRDRETDLELRANGWTVVRIWEHEDPDVAALFILDFLDRRETSEAAPLSFLGPAQ
ncbi:very short patch repair endonuclease [Leifsonia sp. NPDC077715]|uniref:very short patch repair endonuclease n=1 Tax=Leifsonia sp. NPDC077715 TaxID=3155539 RepID=UPI00342E2660